MKLLGVIVLVIGICVGVGQAFYVYDKQYVSSEEIQKESICLALAPECGVCTYETSGNQCIKTEIKRVRGFPITSTGSGVNYQTNQPLGFGHAINLLLFMLPGLAIIVFASVGHKLRRAK